MIFKIRYEELKLDVPSWNDIPDDIKARMKAFCAGKDCEAFSKLADDGCRIAIKSLSKDEKEVLMSVDGHDFLFVLIQNAYMHGFEDGYNLGKAVRRKILGDRK